MVPLVILPLVPLEPLATIEPWIISAANGAYCYSTKGKNAPLEKTLAFGY